ncbi:MAG: InlB B-repeat-containing protein, partial [Candidatus Methanomethylophilaceae archaeon]
MVNGSRASASLRSASAAAPSLLKTTAMVSSGSRRTHTKKESADKATPLYLRIAAMVIPGRTTKSIKPSITLAILLAIVFIVTVFVPMNNIYAIDVGQNSSDMQSVTVNGVTGVIVGNDITVTLPNGTDFGNLAIDYVASPGFTVTDVVTEEQTVDTAVKQITVTSTDTDSTTVYKLTINTGFTVSGKVTDSDSVPISGVTVTLRSYTTVTGDDGMYYLYVEDSTTGTLEFAKTGYGTVAESVPSINADIDIPDAVLTLNTYSVSYDMEGHGTQIPSYSVCHGEYITAPAEPSAYGYRFDGWYKDASFETAWIFSTDEVTSDVMLYAKWTPVCYVVFDSNGHGTDPASVTVTSGSIIAAPDVNVPDGYTFGGWYTDRLCTNEW